VRGEGQNVRAARTQAQLWVAQRASAAVLALCVLVHLATMIYAVRGGLSAGEILGRTRGSLAWGAFYVVFVVAAALHAAIGLRAIAAEWAGVRGAAREALTVAIALVIAALGLRAVWAVVA
jgi:fumarate reductase subunit C